MAGIGRMSPEELKECYSHRIAFTTDDVKLGKDLWQAYKESDLQTLSVLSGCISECFPYLKEVCDAEMARKWDNRPVQTLKKIQANGNPDFPELFARFSVEEGVYGFGDAQVKSMLERTNR
jgi:hypothetical protein